MFVVRRLYAVRDSERLILVWWRWWKTCELYTRRVATREVHQRHRNSTGRPSEG